MENSNLKQEIDLIIAELGDDASIARPAAEREVFAKIRQLLDATREQRTNSAHEIWGNYLPYAAKRCDLLTRLEEGWEDEQDYFASENAQFWLDFAAALMENGDIPGVKNALGQIPAAARMMKRDRIAQVDILLQALEISLELSDKKSSIQLYEEAEKLYRKHLAGGSEYAGSAWLPKIKKMGRQLGQYRDKLRRYFQYSETVFVTMEADSERDLERVIDTLHQGLTGKVTVTRRVKETNDPEKTAAGKFRVRLKIKLE